MEHLSLTLFLPSGEEGAKEEQEALNVSFKKKKKAVQIRLRSKLNKITNRRVACLFAQYHGREYDLSSTEWIRRLLEESKGKVTNYRIFRKSMNESEK